MTNKLHILTRALAAAFDESVGTVDSRWTTLRKAKLWTRVGKGRPRPDPTAKDATRLLLAFLCGGKATEAAHAVRRLEAAEHRGGELPFAWSDTDGQPLGEVVAAVLARMRDGGAPTVRRGDGAADTVAEVSLAVTRSGLGWTARLSARDEANHNHQWIAYYEALDEARAGAWGRDCGAPAPDLITEAQISHRTLEAVAAALRGNGDAAQQALAWSTRVFVTIDREWMGRPNVRMQPASGLIGITQSDYDYLRQLVEDVDLWMAARARLQDRQVTEHEHQQAAELRPVARLLLEEHEAAVAAVDRKKTAAPKRKPRGS